MKKVLLLSFILGVLTQSSLFAEVVPVKKKMGEKWGLKLGFGSSSFSGSNLMNTYPLSNGYSNYTSSYESVSNIFFGLTSLYYPLPFNDKFQFHSEILLSQSGLKYKEAAKRSINFNAETEFKTVFFQIPLLLNYQFSKAYGFRAYVGPYLSLELLSGYKSRREYNLFQDDLAPIDGNDELKKINTFGFGLATGLSYQWEKFSADLRYETSLTDYLNNLSGKLSTFSVSGSYLF